MMRNLRTQDRLGTNTWTDFPVNDFSVRNGHLLQPQHLITPLKGHVSETLKDPTTLYCERPLRSIFYHVIYVRRMLLLLDLPLEGCLQVTLYTNYLIRTLIKALENFTTLVTYQQMSRNWCCLAARHCFGWIDFKGKQGD